LWQPEDITPEAVLAAAAHGGQVAHQAVEGVSALTGVGPANPVNLLNPNAPILGGGLARAGDVFLEPARRAVRAGAVQSGQRRLNIVLWRLGRDLLRAAQ
jgi:glucokinase